MQHSTIVDYPLRFKTGLYYTDGQRNFSNRVPLAPVVYGTLKTTKTTLQQNQLTHCYIVHENTVGSHLRHLRHFAHNTEP